MALKTVNVEFTPDGKVLVEASGYQGHGCDAIIQAIAGQNKIVSQTNKPEYQLKAINTVSK